MNTKQKIQFAIRENPLLIGTLIKDTSINKGFIYRELKKALPCRIGIEFELSGNFLKAFSNKHNLDSTEVTDQVLSNYYGVLDIRPDRGSYSDTDIYEVRISLKDFHHLKGLYIFMQDLNEFCKIHENGGIHIHIDMSSYYDRNNSKVKDLMKYVSNRLDIIENIFPPYKGTYNSRKVGYHDKRSWVNFSRLNTMEFRIAPLTFDYKTLIDWVIKLIKFRQIMISECRLKSSAVMFAKLVNNVINQLGERVRSVNAELLDYDTTDDEDAESNQNSNSYTTYTIVDNTANTVSTIRQVDNGITYINNDATWRLIIYLVLPVLSKGSKGKLGKLSFIVNSFKVDEF